MKRSFFSLSLRSRLLALLIVPLIGMVVFASLWAATRVQAANDADATLERTEVIADLTDLLLDVQVDGRLLAVQSEPDLLGPVTPVLERREKALAAEIDELLARAESQRDTIAELAGTSPEQVELLLDNLPELRERVLDATQLPTSEQRREEIDRTFAAYRTAALRMQDLLQSIAGSESGEIEAPALIALTALHGSVVTESELLLIAFRDGEIDARQASRLGELATEQSVLLRTLSALGLPQATRGITEFRNSASARTWGMLRDSAIEAGLSAPEDGSAPVGGGGLVRGALAANSRATALSDLRTDVADSVLSQSEDAARDARTDLIVASLLAAALIVATFVLGLTTVRRLSARLGALTSRAHQIGQGDLDVPPLDARGNDEITVLARSFDEMAATLAGVSRQADSLAEGRTDDPALAEELPGRIGRSLQGSVARLRKMTTRLRAGEALARSVVETAGEAIWLLDGDQRVVFANEAAASLLGRPADDQTGMTLDQLIDVTGLQGLARGADLSSLDTEALREDGRRVPVLVSSRSITGDRGETLTTVLARDISERKQFEVELVRAASHDGLTGLPNRSSFESQVARASERAKQQGSHFGLLFLDLDRFKRVNDAMGHRVGDGLLAAVAKRLRRAIREEDIVARIGGDEFVILVEDIPDPDILTIQAERLLAAFDAPFVVEGDEVNITASIGVALGDSAVNDPAELLRGADIAMYRAKEAGRGRLARFDSTIRDWSETRRDLEESLREALRNGEVEVAYQPIVRVSDHELWGAELLARWTLDGSPVPPSIFIPIAETTGLVTDIGRRLLEEACDRLGEWRDDPALGELHLTVNVSGKQLMGADLADEIVERLSNADAPPVRLGLELTESYLLEEPDTARVPLERLRSVGVGVAIDDFGTGYASLSYLRALPVDSVKVDSSFLARIGHEPLDRAIVEMVASVAHAAELQVVAEGVETEEQFAAAASAGCDLAQGFYFATPMPLDEFLIWARAGSRLSSLSP